MIHRNSGFLSVDQVARQRGVTPQGIRKAIKEGRLDAYVIGNRWAIKCEDAENFSKIKGWKIGVWKP